MKVSCICPTYRRPSFVERTLQHFLQQTHKDSELIIIDDSPAAEQTSIQDQPRVKVVRLKERVPLGQKHNLGNYFAQGEVLAYWDDDDWFAPNRLERQLQALPGNDIVGIKRDWIADVANGKWLRVKYELSLKEWTGFDFDFEFHDGTAMYTRRVLSFGVYHRALDVTEKLYFLYDCVKKGAKWTSIENENSFVYVRHNANISGFGAHVVVEESREPSWTPSDMSQFWRSISDRRS